MIPGRADARDAWVCPAGHTPDTLPDGARVGTSSNRRRAQLLARRPGLDVRPIRGNVDTRLRKVRDGEYDALILATAGLARLGLREHITETLPLETMLPAPGQGALAVQCRADDERALKILAAIEDQSTRRAVTAERAFLARLGGGCSLPVGAHADVEEDAVSLRAVVFSIEGDVQIDLKDRGADPAGLGRSLADEALERGAAGLLAEAA